MRLLLLVLLLLFVALGFFYELGGCLLFFASIICFSNLRLQHWEKKELTAGENTLDHTHKELLSFCLIAVTVAGGRLLLRGIKMGGVSERV